MPPMRMLVKRSTKRADAQTQKARMPKKTSWPMESEFAAYRAADAFGGQIAADEDVGVGEQV